MSNSLENERIIQFFKALFGWMILVVCCLAIFREFDHDEFEAIHTSWKVLAGEKIYTDFFQHHHPLFYYFMVPVISLFGENTETVLILRLIMLSMYGLMLWCLYELSMTIFQDRKIAWLSSLLLICMAMFSNKAVEIRPDVPQVLFGMVGILFHFQFIRDGRKLKFFISAISLALSFLFLQKTIFIIAAAGVVQIIWIFKNRLKFQHVILYWMIFGLAITPYYLYLFLTDGFETYLFFNWILNIHFEGGFSPFRTIIDSFYYNHFVWIFGVVGMVVCLKKKYFEVSILGLLLLVTVFFAKSPYRQYFMPFAFILCMMAAYAMLEFLKLKQLKVIVTLAFLVPMIYLVWTMIVYPNELQLDKIDWVLDNTETSDYVYDGDAYFNLYRKDIDFFWYSIEPGRGGLGTYKSLRPYRYDIYRSIEFYEPKIISDTFIDNMDSETIQGHYRPSTSYPSLYMRLKE